MNLYTWFRSVRRGILALLASSFIPITAISQPIPDLTDPGVRAVVAVQEAITPELIHRPGVLGLAVGFNSQGEPDLVVYVDREHGGVAELVRSLPPQIRGVSLRALHTDKFVAYRPKSKTPTVTVNATAKQAHPIQLGTSGGWQKDLANGVCCGGTLGSLVKVNGVQYILSNYHVLEADIVSGGNGMVASTGAPVIQPGLIDVNCSAANANQVGTLVKLGSLPNYNVDVAVAQVTPGMVRTDGSILGIGPLSAQTAGAYLGQRVKKTGRTTGFTRSSVSGLNATINVTYENECGGAAAFTKTFRGQIVLSNSNNSFLNSGDSGSLLVEDVASYPRAIGLLFAGSSTSAIANPIYEVLQFVGGMLGGTATMVGY